MDFSLLTRQLFGDDVLTKPLSLPAVSSSTDDVNEIKASLKQKALKKAQRNKIIIAEKVRVQAKMESIEKQRQAILDNRKNFHGLTK